ncbi:MAG TPA: LysM domain-containing protein [Solirubrobacterales bacterium]
MTQRSSAPARALALAALIGGFLVLVAVIASSVGDGGKGGRSGGAGSGQVRQGGDGEGKAPKAYVVQNGDTLTSIANETGVPVSRIEELNPGVDPQILVSGEKLKLR